MLRVLDSTAVSVNKSPFNEVSEIYIKVVSFIRNVFFTFKLDLSLMCVWLTDIKETHKENTPMRPI